MPVFVRIYSPVHQPPTSCEWYLELLIPWLMGDQYRLLIPYSTHGPAALCLIFEPNSFDKIILSFWHLAVYERCPISKITSTIWMIPFPILYYSTITIFYNFLGFLMIKSIIHYDNKLSISLLDCLLCSKILLFVFFSWHLMQKISQ